jgi:hypothetical protein
MLCGMKKCRTTKKNKIFQQYHQGRECAHEQTCGNNIAGSVNGQAGTAVEPVPLHVHEVIQDTLDNYQLQLKDKEGEISSAC